MACTSTDRIYTALQNILESDAAHWNDLFAKDQDFKDRYMAILTAMASQPNRVYGMEE